MHGENIKLLDYLLHFLRAADKEMQLKMNGGKKISFHVRRACK